MAKTTTRKSYHEMGSISFQGPDHKMTHNVKAYRYILTNLDFRDGPSDGSWREVELTKGSRYSYNIFLKEKLSFSSRLRYTLWK